MPSSACRRAYDHRLRDLVYEEHDPSLFNDLGVPRSTAASWIRPRRRLYPAKPKQGIRASNPNEYWHIDVTVIRLLGGTRTYLHAVLDNFGCVPHDPSMTEHLSERADVEPA